MRSHKTRKEEKESLVKPVVFYFFSMCGFLQFADLGTYVSHLTSSIPEVLNTRASKFMT